MRADYVVVGAGAAGCVLAGRLAQDRGVSVILVEAGGSRRGMITRVPGTAFLASVSTERNWGFVTEPVPGLNGRRLKWNQGRILGGSSSINGMLYMRGQPREFDLWRQIGCAGWGHEDVLAAFRRAEHSTRGESEWHGVDGPMTIKPANIDLPICQAFLDALAQNGYPVVDDLNAGVVEGFGRFDTNIRRGERSSAATAYIDPVRRQDNFSVVDNALASRVVVEGGRATGVEVRREGVWQTIHADREVILCGGSINSPQLLMLSGIGPADELSAHGIKVVHDAPEVGRNLRNHAAYRLAYAVDEPITAYSYMRPTTAIGLGLRYLLTRGGSLGESYVATGGFFRSDPAMELSDMIVVMAPALVTRGAVGSSVRDLFPSRHGFAVSVSLGRPQSTGEIKLRSADPAEPPLIFPNYYAEQADMDAMVQAVRRMRDMMRTDTVARYITSELEPGTGVADDDASLEAEIRANGGTFYHPTGTCRMGVDPGAVLDPQLRVIGVEGLRVADNSVMPAALSACTHAPAIMIGEQAASFIRA